MRKESGFVPIHDASTENIRFNLDLPAYLDRDSVKANTNRLQQMMDLGGISHLRIETFESDRVTQSPLVLGHNTQGEAYAGNAGLSSQTKNREIKDEEDLEDKQPMVSALVRIDIQSIVSKSNGKSLRSSKLWANEINKAAQEALRDGGKEVLLKKNISHNSGRALMLFFISPERVITTNSITGNPLGDLAVHYFVTSTVLNAVSHAVSPDERFSFFIGPQVDRWAVLQARTRTQRVVKGF